MMLRRFLSLCAPFVVLLAGCDAIGACYPVEGQIIVDGKPLQGTAGLVMFVPDKSKGTTLAFNPIGDIDKTGKYSLKTKDRPGAPAGWYKVVVNPVPPGLDDRGAVKTAIVHDRFTVEKSTPLTIEVVAAPGAGAYDLKVSKN